MSRRLAWGVILVLLPALPAGAAPAAKKQAKPAAARSRKAPLPVEDGVWKVTVTPDPEAAAKGEKAFEDTLMLHQGKFSSSACAAYGFPAAAYQVEAELWSANPESPREGKAHWHAEVSGDAITGKMVWTKSDGTVLNYSFTGSRAGAAAGQTQKTH